jgi:hypothetical protein
MSEFDIVVSIALGVGLAAVAIVVAFCWLAVRFACRLFRRMPAQPTHE